MAEWVRALDWRPGGPGSNPAPATNFASELNFAIPFIPLCSVSVFRAGAGTLKLCIILKFECSQYRKESESKVAL